MKLIDTSVLIKWLQGGELKEGCISIITLIEVLRGISSHERGEVKSALEEIYEIVPLDNEVIGEYCNLYEALTKGGTKIPDVDLLIAAYAKAKNLPVITSDKHFEQLQGLGVKIEIE